MSIVYNIAKKRLIDGSLDLSDSKINVLLVMSGTTAGTSTSEDRSTLGQITTLTELDTNTGYTAGGAQITNTSVTTDNTNEKGRFDADNVTWSNVQTGKRIVGAVVYQDTGSYLICYLTFTSFTTGGGDVTIAWNASGILQTS